MSTNGVTDTLINTIGKWRKPDDKYVYVYDGYWQMSRPLYDEVVKARWDDVILNEEMKKTITELMHKFFDSEDVYKDLGVPWKRGVIFHGAYILKWNMPLNWRVARLSTRCEDSDLLLTWETYLPVHCSVSNNNADEILSRSCWEWENHQHQSTDA